MPRTPTWKEMQAERKRKEADDIMRKRAEEYAREQAALVLRERLAKENAMLRFPQALEELANIERDARRQPEHVTAFDLIARLADTLQGLVMELSKP